MNFSKKKRKNLKPEEKKKKSEAKLKKIKEASSKTNYYLQKIKEIYGDLKSYELNYNNLNNMNNYAGQNNLKMMNNQIYQEKNLNVNNYSNYTNDMNNNTTNLRGRNLKEGELGDSNEGMENIKLDTYNNSENEIIPFRGKKAVRMFGGLIILLSLIGSLRRPDFPNAVEGILVVLCCYIGIKRGIEKALKWFKYAIIGDLTLLVYDFTWLCTHYNFMFIGNYTGGSENFIGFLSVICCGISILVKASLWVLLYKQYTDMKKIEQDNNKIDSNF